jgi:hypothetical protein
VALLTHALRAEPLADELLRPAWIAVRTFGPAKLVPLETSHPVADRLARSRGPHRQVARLARMVVPRLVATALVVWLIEVAFPLVMAAQATP